MNEQVPKLRTSVHERGFTMIEVAIVMLIVVILAAIAIPTFFGAKDNAKQSEFVGVARSYVVAIEAFRLDHSGQAPVIGSANWPVAANGPINTMPGLPESKQRYMRSGVSPAITSGQATIGTAATGAKQHIQYIVSPAPDGATYSLVVTNGSTRCSLGSAVAGVKACP